VGRRNNCVFLAVLKYFVFWRRAEGVANRKVRSPSHGSRWYNDHGDKASERETMVMRSDTGPWNLTESGAFVPTGKPNPPQPPSSSETQYTYQYDQYGNWTEQTLSAALNRTKHFDPRMSFVVSWVTTNVCRCSAWRFPARLPINRHYAHCGQAPSQWSYRARSWPFGFAEEGLRREWVIASP